MKCRINYNENGSVESITDEQGNRSPLFDNLSQAVGNEKARDIFALTETEEFKNIQSIKKSKIADNNKVIIANQTRDFADSIGAKRTDRLNSFVYSDGDVSLYFKPVYQGNKTIEAELIENKGERGKGLARKVFQKFVNEAGAQGFTITGVISPRDASTKESELKKFYKSLGFVNNGTDFEIIRKPLKSDKEAQTVESKPIKDVITFSVEPTMEEAITFATRKDNELSEQDQIDLTNSINSLGMSSYGELINKIEKSLLNNGVLVFTEDSLIRSGLYNKYETNYILNDINLQNEIRRIYQGLKNSENKIVESVNPLFVVKTSSINSFGKQNILNPYLVEKEVTQIIAGEDLNISLDRIPYDSVKNEYKNNLSSKQELDRISNNNRNIAQKTIEFGELVDKTTNNNRQLFEKTLDLGARNTLVPIVNLLSDVTPTVWQNSLDSVYAILKDFNKKAIQSGIDFLDLEDKTLTKTQNEILELLESFSDLLEKPSDNNMDYFFDVYSEFFSLENTPVQKTVETRQEDNIYLETNESELNLFKNHNLIRESENVYKEIETVTDTEEAYDILFENKDKFPESITTKEELKEYVNSLVNNYNTEEFDVNLSDLENMIIHKLYFNSEINTDKVTDKQAPIKFSAFNGNFEYLTKAFASDFYKEYIKEKRKNSEVFKNFYSNFDITDKGIVLKENDPITISKMEPYMTENIQMYNLISKNLNLPLYATQVSENLNEMEFKREYAISNPNTVPKLKGDFMVMSSETIAVRNEVEPIIKTPTGIYEIDYQAGDVAFYNKLPEGNSNFNSFGQYKIKTDSSLDLREYSEMEIRVEDFTKAKNFYSKKELEDINEKFFSC